MSETIGLRERKKRDRRRQIEDVAVELFEQQGFDATTIEQIAAAAEIAPRTFFSYFETKDDVVIADYADRLGRILEELDQRPADEPTWRALRAAFAAVASDYATEVDRLARRFGIMATTPSVQARSLQLQAGWEHTLAAHLATRMGAAASDPTPRLLAATAVAVMRASLQHWLTAPQAVELPTLVQDAFDRLGAGLAR
ncbi:TetR family transcriptional regulator [Acidimicrobiia bacterium EGI L10123]|uniref:acyl-CoA-like ligand-binding transcription factor n=1 Tax=Salinilacustrithrix flava TaxID=2957203 RepID=UPI003D7C2B0B|nr:TetR family transcriptional regulator [Acidimicrobiia bacterium EGI L10123]